MIIIYDHSLGLKKVTSIHFSVHLRYSQNKKVNWGESKLRIPYGTLFTDEISSTLDPNEKFILWWVVSYEYILDHFEDRVLGRNKGTENLEFEF